MQVSEGLSSREYTKKQPFEHRDKKNPFNFLVSQISKTMSETVFAIKKINGKQTGRLLSPGVTQTISWNSRSVPPHQQECDFWTLAGSKCSVMLCHMRILDSSATVANLQLLLLVSNLRGSPTCDTLIYTRFLRQLTARLSQLSFARGGGGGGGSWDSWE